MSWTRTKEVKRKRTALQLKKWRNPKYAKKQSKAIREGLNCITTRPERRLRNGLNKMFPGEYKFVGDGSIWIVGKILS